MNILGDGTLKMPILKASVIGWPIEHSLSPRIHGYWLKELGIDGAYEKIAVEPNKLAGFFDELRQGELRGINITLPHKEEALSLVDWVDPLAQHVGAINTVLVQEKKLLGYNTDVYGFAENLRAGGFVMGKAPVVFLGAGGAARAGLVALLDMGAQEIRLMNRSRDKAEALAKEFGAKIKVAEWDDETALQDAQLLVNATSLGLGGQNDVPLSLNKLPKTATVTDMVYKPLQTGLLRRAAEKGCTTIDGLGMLLYQAQKAFHIFYGTEPKVTEELRRSVMA